MRPLSCRSKVPQNELELTEIRSTLSTNFVFTCCRMKHWLTKTVFSLKQCAVASKDISVVSFSEQFIPHATRKVQDTRAQMKHKLFPSRKKIALNYIAQRTSLHETTLRFHSFLEYMNLNFFQTGIRYKFRLLDAAKGSFALSTHCSLNNYFVQNHNTQSR